MKSYIEKLYTSEIPTAASEKVFNLDITYFKYYHIVDL